MVEQTNVNWLTFFNFIINDLKLTEDDIEDLRRLYTEQQVRWALSDPEILKDIVRNYFLGSTYDMCLDEFVSGLRLTDEQIKEILSRYYSPIELTKLIQTYHG